MTNAMRILIATHHLQDYAGSEIATLELACEFRSAGWEVHIASFLTGNPILSVFHERGFNVLCLIDDIAAMLDVEYELVWMHHAPVYYQLCIANQIRAKRIIHSCLSPFEPLEALPEANGRIDWILANSEESKKVIEDSLGGADDRIIMFPNAVSHPYWDHAKESCPSTLKKIAIISNHLPPELQCAARKMEEEGMEIVHIGRGGCSGLVTPEMLIKFDAVITIGKTIQYCFALKIPVFCYDHFGGPGWINEKNYDLSAYHNFSGRGYSKKPADLIVKEVCEDYELSRKSINFLYEQAIQNFDLRLNLKKILERPKLHSPSLFPHEASSSVILMQHAYYLRLLKQLKAQESRENALAINKLDLEKYIDSIRGMWAWKLNAPFRYIERLIRAKFS